MLFSENLLLNKRIVVTGATSGIGKSVANLCAELGASVSLVGRSDERLAATLSGLKIFDSSQSHSKLVGDLSSFDGAVEVFKEIQKMSNGIDAVFYSAGLELIKATRSLKAADIDQTCGASFLGAMGAAKVCASKRFWRNSETGGALVFMSSVSAKRGQIGMAGYAGARAGVLGLSRNLAVELADLGVRVNSIVAGAVNTEMHTRILSNLGTESKNQYERAHPLGVVEKHEIASLFVFLISAAGRHITGSEFVIDGGFLA